MNILFVIFWMLNLYFFILMCQSWSRENKYSISLIWAYQLDMVVIMKLWFIIIIIQGATFINNNNMFFPVLFSQSPHSCFRMNFIFSILREKKKQTRNFSLKSWLSLSGKRSKVLLDKNVHYIRFHHLYSLNVLWWISLVWLAQRHIM